MSIFYSFDSSVGRAEDCNGKLLQTSIGRWFNSGSKESFLNVILRYLFFFVKNNFCSPQDRPVFYLYIIFTVESGKIN